MPKMVCKIYEMDPWSNLMKMYKKQCMQDTVCYSDFVRYSDPKRANLYLNRVNRRRLILQGPILPAASSQFPRYFWSRKFASRSGNFLKMKQEGQHQVQGMPRVVCIIGN